MERLDFDGEIVWRPRSEYVAHSHLKRFMDRHGFATLEQLQGRATADIARFWEAVFDYLDIQFYEPFSRVVDLSGGKPWARWCVGAKMNIVHNCLDKWMGGPTQKRAALRWEGEEGATRILSYGDLNRQVNRLANALRGPGLGRGDAIGLYMPMVPEIAIALLAIVKIGGVILLLFSGYGAGAAAIGVPHPIKGQAVVCFCVLQPGYTPSDVLAQDLQALAAQELGKPLKPSEVHFVPDLPRTRNAKVMRRVIRAAYHGDGAGDLSALVNPEAVEAIQ